jgi:hypothetical protein
MLGCLCFCSSDGPGAVTKESKALEDEIRLQDKRLDKIIAACGGKKYEGEDYVEEKLEENGIKKDDDRKEDGSDVLKDYGFGIVAYFDILFSLFVIFCVLSIFSMSLIFLYKK